jgi:hypothetical protein
VTARRSGAALLTLCGAQALAAVSTAGQPIQPPHKPDAGTAARARDAGGPVTASTLDGGPRATPLSAEDVEVVSNLELLEHLPESDVLDLLLPLRDE